MSLKYIFISDSKSYDYIYSAALPFGTYCGAGVYRQVSVYPNPASDKLVVEFSELTDTEKVELEIYNNLGVLIKQESYTQNLKYSLNLNGIDNGSYLYKVKVNGKVLRNEKLLIIR